MHYVIEPQFLWGSIAELARTQHNDLLLTLQKGFNYIENQSFESTFQGLGYPLKPGHPKVSMGYEQQADEPFLAKEVHPFAQPTLQKGQGIGC